MKHFVEILLSLLLALSFMVGCSQAVRAEDLAGKSYRYEKDGFGSDFVINLEEDGSFIYYEGSLSSYIGSGKWSVKGDILTLQEKRRTFLFRVNGGDLVFQQEGSGDFLYVKVSNGDKFTAEK